MWGYKELGLLEIEILLQSTIDTKLIGEYGRLASITEMAIDIHMLGNGAGYDLRRHKIINYFVRIDIKFVLIKSFESSYEGIQSFGVVFGNEEFDAGGVESQHLYQRITELADRFGKTDHLFVHKFNISLKVLTEFCEKGSIRDFGKLYKSLSSIQRFRKRMRRESVRKKIFLQDESRKKTGKGISTVMPKTLV